VQFAELIGRIEANDKEIEYINGYGCRAVPIRLREVELVARGLEGWFKIVTETLRITKKLRLLAFEYDVQNPYIWPRHR
jgi:hypothetical protein